MKRRQRDSLGMFQTVDKVLEKHNAVWSANVPFSEAVNEFRMLIEEIWNLAEKQSVNNTGIRKDKDIRRAALEEKTYKAIAALVFYCSVSGNSKLRSKIYFTKTTLAYARDKALPGISKQVHRQAAAHAAALLPFGLTAAAIDALEDAIDEFISYLDRPRLARREIHEVTRELKAAFASAKKLLKLKLDRGIYIFRASAPEFFARYFKARLTARSPMRKRALEVHIENITSKKPVANAPVIIDGKIKKRSSARGNLRVQNLSDGSHTLNIAMPRYAPFMQRFNTVSGQTAKLIIRLIPS